jgi:hypothetical protein
VKLTKEEEPSLAEKAHAAKLFNNLVTSSKVTDVVAILFTNSSSDGMKKKVTNCGDNDAQRQLPTCDAYSNNEVGYKNKGRE